MEMLWSELNLDQLKVQTYKGYAVQFISLIKATYPFQCVQRQLQGVHTKSPLDKSYTYKRNYLQ